MNDDANTVENSVLIPDQFEQSKTRGKSQAGAVSVQGQRRQRFPRSAGFLLAFIPTIVLVLTPVLGRWLGSEFLVTLLPFFVYFVVIPIADKVIGCDEGLFRVDQGDFFSSSFYYVSLLLLAVLVQMAAITWAAFVFVGDTFSIWGKLIWIAATGLVASGLGITVAHELVHKNSRFLQTAGGILLSTVCYPGFKVEHVRGHHVNIGTPQDPTTAKFKQSLFQFLPKALMQNVLAAFRLEAKRLERANLGPISWRNEMIWWWSITVFWMLLLATLFGVWGGVFFVAQGLVAATTLETINYVEHYGLERQLLESGKYERVTEQHSWNSNYLLSNFMLFQLQRHSDHHASPKTLYASLAPMREAPQLPYGYPTMLILAWFPRAWFKVMNPRVMQWRAANGL